MHDVPGGDKALEETGANEAVLSLRSGERCQMCIFNYVN